MIFNHGLCPPRLPGDYDLLQLSEAAQEAVRPSGGRAIYKPMMSIRYVREQNGEVNRSFNFRSLQRCHRCHHRHRRRATIYLSPSHLSTLHPPNHVYIHTHPPHQPSPVTAVSPPKTTSRLSSKAKASAFWMLRTLRPESGSWRNIFKRPRTRIFTGTIYIFMHLFTRVSIRSC